MRPDPITLSALNSQVRQALEEDIGSGDLTAELIPPSRRMSGVVIAREPGVLAGTDWFDEVFRQLGDQVSVRWQAGDGETVAAGQTLCQLQGPARPLLSGERTALNFLQLLSAVASRTDQYVKAIADTGCKILDTRKTLPGLRLAQKYAVLCGGGNNHRFGLFDAILIKENHIASAGGIAHAVSQARTLNNQVMVEVEVETADELDQAIAAGADRILLDNFSIAELVSAVAATAGQSELEASGGITLESIRAIAETGVDFISVGELTKTITALDLSMRLND
ncbi:MAG: carboxylating nicotinate-nucleotide diphosphorylase [Gammaproteobacteria bacterium]